MSSHFMSPNLLFGILLNEEFLPVYVESTGQ